MGFSNQNGGNAQRKLFQNAASTGGKEGDGLKHLGERRAAVCEAEGAGMELYLAEKRKAGINLQGSLAAGSLPQLLCAQG